MAMLITFEDIKSLFGHGASLPDFTCINFTSNPSHMRCTKLDGLRLEKAHSILNSILSKGKQYLTKDTLRDLIKCLLCKDDQKAAKHLLRRWCEELGISISPLGRPRKSLDPTGSSRGATRSPSSSRSSSERSDSPSGAAPVTPCPSWPGPAQELDMSECIESQHEADAMEGVTASNDAYQHRIEEAQTSAARKASREPSPQRHACTDPRNDSNTSSPGAERDQAKHVETSDTESNVSYLHQEFRAGDRCEATDGVICQNLLETLLKPINAGSTSKKSDLGWVYAARVQGHKQALVKIGITTGSVEDRLKAIERSHGLTLDKDSFVAVPQPSFERLEKVVFAELAGFERILQRTRMNGSSRLFKEFYAVDLATAETAIRRWSERMDRLDFRAGFDLDSRLCTFIWTRHNALLLKSRTLTAANNEAQSDEKFSHHDRQKFWAEVFLDDIGGAKMAMQPPYTFTCIVWALFMLSGLALYFCAPRLLVVFLLMRCLWSLDYAAWHVCWLRRMHGKATWPA